MSDPAAIVVEGDVLELVIEEEGLTLELWSGFGDGRATHLRDVVVSTTAPTPGQVLVYDGTEATWTDIATQLELDALTATVAAHAARTDNPHAVTKAQVGLANVENTALSTWAGSGNITTVGTLVAGAVPFGLVTPGTAAAGTYILPVTSTLVVGHSAALTDLPAHGSSSGGQGSASAQVYATSSANAGFALGLFVASAGGGGIVLLKSRAASIGGLAIVQNGDVLGQYVFAGDDGVDHATIGARIRAEISGSPAANRLPTQLLLQVAAGVSDNDIATRVTITAAASTFAGNLIFGTDNTYDIGASAATRPRDLFLGRNASVGGTLGVTGASALTGDLTVGGNAVAGPSFSVNGTAGSNRDFQIKSAGSARWTIRCNATAESGSDAGSNLQVIARTDAAVQIDIPFTIARAAGGAITLARPVTITGKLTTAASASGGAGLIVPHGAAPSAPTDGAVWSTTAGFFGRVNGVTKQFTMV